MARAGGRVAAESRTEIDLAETADPATRHLTMRGFGSADVGVRRIDELMAFLDGQPRWRGARIAYLQGDASTRSYAPPVRSRWWHDPGSWMHRGHSDGPATLAAQAYRPHRPSGREHALPLWP